MTIDKINITQTLDDAKLALKQDQLISASTRAVFQIMLLLVVVELMVELMANKLGLNSRNSSIAPSQDIHRKKSATSKRIVTGKKTSGQPYLLEARLRRLIIPMKSSRCL